MRSRKKDWIAVLGVLSGVAVALGVTCERPRTVVPASAQVSEAGLAVHIDVADRRPISPYVYGVNGVELPRAHPGRFTLIRLGGDRTSSYNWEINASNAGTYYIDSSDAYLGESTAPAGAILDVIRLAAEQHAAALVTIPMMGRVAGDRAGQVRAEDLERRTVQVRASCPGEAMNASDDHVCTDQLVRYVVEHTPEGTPVFFSLDNEPELWPTTHTLLFGRAHLTYEELLDRSRAHFAAIRSVAPEARVLGPASFGFPAFGDLLGASDANGRPFLATYVAALPGVTLDVHWYPDVRVGEVAVSSGSSDPEVARVRVQLPRSLYDPSYREPSWIVNDSLHEPIDLIHRLSHPLAITEYDYGGGEDVSGAIAEADALGALGREGVTAATFWPLTDQGHTFDVAAFDLYRRFFPTSVAARSSDVERLSSWASIDDATGRIALVLVHRAEESEAVRVEGARGSFERFVLDARGPEVRSEPELQCEERCELEIGARSVTLLVARP
jgi:hypothetical protein